MIKRRRLRLDFEAFALVITCRNLSRQEFDGDEALELGVLGIVDDTHTALAEFFCDFVVKNCLADHDLFFRFLQKRDIEQAANPIGVACCCDGCWPLPRFMNMPRLRR